MDIQLMQNVARSIENAPHWENDIVLMEVIKRNEQYPIKLYNRL